MARVSFLLSTSANCVYFYSFLPRRRLLHPPRIVPRCLRSESHGVFEIITTDLTSSQLFVASPTSCLTRLRALQVVGLHFAAQEVSERW